MEDPDDTQSRSRIQLPILALMANVPSLSVVRDQARPKKLGRYELEECLGAEGGRETYRARVRGLAGFDRIFALKCLRRRPGVVISRSDPFLTTAKRLTSVTDTRVVRMLDADVIDGAGIVVTEFIHGLDLERFREWAQVSGELATGSDSAAQKWQKLVAYLGSEISGALAAMHAIAPPLVHGGLSPRNVIITTRGSIKVLDVGLGAAAQKGGDALSQRALAYAPPGPPGVEPTAPSDVHALGAMLFELATGELRPPEVTSAAARRMLESSWPAMAEFIASMMAEDPALRPRAAKAVEILAGAWSEIPDASMASEMAALVRNFSAFVADSSPPAGSPTSSAEPAAAEKILPPSSGILSMPPPVAPASSSSFLNPSDQATRVSPDVGYASAIFRALPTDASPPGAATQPPRPVVPLSVRPAAAPTILGRSPTMRAFAALKPPESAAPKQLDPRFAPRGKPVATADMEIIPLADDPVISTMPAKAAALPPPAAVPLRASLRSSLPAPATGSIAAPTPQQASELSAEPEIMAEAADWGAQALAALGTQAGLQIALLPPGPEGRGDLASPFAPPLPVSDPAIEEAFAFSPLPPQQEPWSASPPPPAAVAVQPFQATSFQAPPFVSPARAELLEDDLMEDEQTPILVPTGGGGRPLPEPEAYSEELEEPEEPALEEPTVLPTEGTFSDRSALEATAFIAGEETESAQELAPTRFAQEMESPEARPPRQPLTRSALKSRTSLAEDDVSDESWQPPRSRAKKIAVVLILAAGLGAGAAALMIGLGKKGPAPVTQRQPHPKKAVPAAAAVAPATPVGKAEQTADPKLAVAKAAPSPTAAGGKAAVAKPQRDSQVVVSAKAAPTAVAAKDESPPKVAALPVASLPAKAPESAAVKPAQVAIALPGPSLGAPSGAAVRVRVSSEPSGARVWINGEERGDTPCAVDVKSGSARVVLVHAGYLTSQSTVEVREGTKIDETLKAVEPPMTGEARFRAECQTLGKLPVVVDGKETGILCPYSKMRVDPGTHTIGLLVPATGKIHQKEITLSPGVRSVVFGD